jgi:hypothetical protein
MFSGKKTVPIYRSDAYNDPSDVFYRYNTLLLHAENKTTNEDILTLPPFIDISQNKIPIKTTGALSPGTFNPYNPYNGFGYSAFFDGVGDRFTVPYSAENFDFGSGDFTLECWVNPRNTQPDGTTVGWIVTGVSNVGSNTRWALKVQSGSLNASPDFQFMIAGGDNVSTAVASGWASVNGYTLRNRWYHLIVAKVGNAASLYVNGKFAGTIYPGTITAPDTIIIGANISSGTYSSHFHGHISNLKIVKGVNPLFVTRSGTVFTQALNISGSLFSSGYYLNTNGTGSLPINIPSTGNTVLLTFQNSYIKDNSPNNLTLTRAGDVSIEPFSPLPSPYISYGSLTHTDAVQIAVGANAMDKSLTNNAGAVSVYNDASTKYLSAGSENFAKATRLGSGDFCVETWVYFNTLGANRMMVESWASNVGWQLYYTNTTAKFAWFNTAAITLSSTTTPVIGQWYHVVASKSSGVLRMFVNGVLEASVADSTNYAPTAPLATGVQLSTITNLMAGYLSDVRITTGNAVYGGNFTPPYVPLQPVNGTQFLLRPRDIGIKDSTGKNNILAEGGTAISTSIKKFGNSSIFFDGVNDYLQMQDSNLFDFGAGPFTVEAWLYRTSGGGSRLNSAVFSQGSYGTLTDTSFYLGAGTDGLALYLSDTGTTWTATLLTNTALTLDTWTHVVWQRRFEQSADHSYGNSYLEIYLDGILQGTPTLVGSNTIKVFNSSRKIMIGSQGGSDAFWKGYIDELRVTIGVSRYGGKGATGANFTSPVRPFSNRG